MSRNKTDFSEHKALEILLGDVLSQVDNVSSLQKLTQIFLEILMKKERELFLSNQQDNKANGYYSRDLACMFGNLNLKVPRDRLSFFRPLVLPSPYQKADESFNNFVLNLILHNYSPNKIKSILNSLNLPYSPEQIEELKDDFCQKAKEFLTRQLPENVFSLFIDAYHVQIKDDDTKQIKESVIYNVLGIDMSGKKDLYGSYISQGKENREDWLVILNNLIQRGLKRVLLIISDDFPGLDQAIKTLFPNTDHQLCFIHMQRNVRRNMSKTDAKEFNKSLTSIRLISDYDKAIAMFENLCEEYKNKYPTFIKYLLAKKYLYFSFIKYPEPLRKHIYTTNIVENLHSRIELIRINSGGHFQSTKTAEISIFLTVENLKKGKWFKPLPAFREALYEINQLFATRFYKETQNFV